MVSSTWFELQVAPSRKALALGAVVDAHFVDQCILVGGKVLVDVERVAERNQRHQIGRLHLRAQKILRRLHAAVQILRLHRGEVEEHHDQAVIAQILGARHDRAARWGWSVPPAASPLTVASFSGVAWSTLSKSKVAICCCLPFS